MIFIDKSYLYLYKYEYLKRAKENKKRKWKKIIIKCFINNNHQ